MSQEKTAEQRIRIRGRGDNGRPYLLFMLIVYVIGFYSLWTAWEFWGKALIDRGVENEGLAQLIKSGIVKNLVWTVPAIMLTHRFKSEVNIPLKEMFCRKVNWVRYLPVFAVFTAYILAGSVLKNGRITVNSAFGVEEVIIVAFVGLTEETVFRGWLLNAMMWGDRKWTAILLNALMFLTIHFPTWIRNGIFVSSFQSLAFLEIIALSVLFSVTFLKSRSILVPIALHMYWDLLVFLLIGA